MYEHRSVPIEMSSKDHVYGRITLPVRKVVTGAYARNTDSQRKNILKDGAYRRPNPKLKNLRSSLLERVRVRVDVRIRRDVPEAIIVGSFVQVR